VGQLAASFNRMVEGIIEAQERLRRSEKETFRSEKLATVGRLAAGSPTSGEPADGDPRYAEHLLKHSGVTESKECLDKVVEETKKIENLVRGSSPWRLRGREGRGDGRERRGARGGRDALVPEPVPRRGGALDLGETPRAAILEDRFRQVLLNLVINAVDAMKGAER